MKRRGPSRALVALAVAGLVACIGSTAQAQENIYENVTGLMGGSIVPAPGPVTSGPVIAGPRLNPNGIGQYLVGAYYDVRPVNGDAQAVNIQIINTNTNNSALPQCTLDDVLAGRDGAGCYNPLGGVLIKVRFRESRLSREALDFVIPLSCGEVWAGVLELGTNDLPRVRSIYPIATGGSTNTTIESDDLLNTPNGQSFVLPATPPGLSNADVQRGYIEVIAMESLFCEPDNAQGVPNAGVLDIDGGNTWTRVTAADPQFCPQDIGCDPTPSNSIGAEAFLVRAASGVSHAYNFAAVSAFVASGAGSIAPPGNLFADSLPDWSSCRGFDILGNPYANPTVDCVHQVNLALSKSRLIAQYDVSPLTAGSTDVVITLPTKYENCNVAGSPARWTTPIAILGDIAFTCDPDGEEIACTVYNREEEFDSPEQPPFSPSPPDVACVLPRELTIFHISEAGGLGARGDIGFATGNLDPSDSGWVDFDLVRNAEGEIVHSEEFLTATTHDILGAYLSGYQGLPALGLVVQEFFNGNVGGTYGATVPTLAEQIVLKPGQS